MKVAALQMVSSPRRDDNLATARQLLEQAAASGVELAVLPEYFSAMGARDTDKLALRERPGDGVVQSFLAQAARDLDLHETVLRSWIRELATDPQQAFPGKGVMKPEQAELDRLRKEVAKLKMERDILKKAAAYFAKDSL